MSRRKWLVRGLVLLVAGGLAAAGLLYQYWTNPAAVRQQVIEQLGSHFVGVRVNLESARLRLLGGIAVRELRLSRRDDLDRTDFAYFPSAVIYHDKEQLMDGKLAVRKIELQRPRLRVIRGRDGNWNVAGILGPVELDKPLPTIVMQQATLVLEDLTAPPGTLPIEIRDFHLTLINDPLETVTFEGSGTSDAARSIHVKGSWQRASGDTLLEFEVDGMPVGPALVQRFTSYCPELAAHLRQFEAEGKLEGEVRYQPDAVEPWSHDCRLQVSQGKLEHARLPLPLDHIEASLHCVNGQVPHVRAKARAGAAEIDLTIHDLKLCCGESLPDMVQDLKLHLKHLAIRPELFARLPEEYRAIQEDYRPQGIASLDFTFEREPSGRWQKRCTLRPEDLKGSCRGFPYLLEQITGTLDYELASDREEVFKIDLVGRSGTRPIHIKGEVAGASGRRAVQVDIWGDNVPLDEKLMAALPQEHQALARSFHATGVGDFRGYIRQDRGSDSYRNRYLVSFHHAAVRHDAFPYPLENVSGLLDIHPDHWEFSHFRGTHKGGEFRTRGRSSPSPQGSRVVMDIEGINILMDEEMAVALEKEAELKHTWKVFSPSGRIEFRGRIDALEGKKPDIDLTVYPRGCSIRPEFFPYSLDDLHGRMRYARNWVQVEKLSARHGETVLGLDQGLIYVKPEGGIWAKLTGLKGAPLVPDADFQRALPPLLARACKSLGLKDPLTLNTELVIDSPAGSDPPIIYWDGTLGLRNVSLDAGVRLERIHGAIACRGRHNGKQLEGVVGNLLLDQATLFRQPLHQIHSQIEITPDEPEVLRLPGIRARYCGGEIYGPARVEFGPTTIRYELNLTAAQVKLEEFGRQNLGPGAELQGLASARLYLSGRGTDINDLKGNGSIDVPSGKMYNLPLLLDLLKVLGLRLPDRTAFEEAHATFNIEGPRVQLSRLDLYGNAISLRGQGRMNLDGSDMDLDFHADWARINQLLPPLIDKIPMTISNQLLRINMRGRVGEVHCTKEPVPLLMDPLKKIMKSSSRSRPGDAGPARLAGPAAPQAPRAEGGLRPTP